MSERNVAIIGLGLIGGSLARDLSARGFRVIGSDRNHDAVARALEENAIAASVPRDLEGIEAADDIVIALPVDRVERALITIANRGARPRLVMDVASTKRSVVGAAARSALAARFVGAHPLAGDHRSSWAASRRGLFAGRTVFLCRTRRTEESAVRVAAELWRACNAQTCLIDAATHDARMARMSHLPQLVATALALELSAGRVPRGSLGSGGNDMTRLAGSAPDVWVSIVLDNADQLASVLARHESLIATIRSAIERGDRTTLRRMLSRAQRWSERDS